jgi:hypothetical protein
MKPEDQSPRFLQIRNVIGSLVVLNLYSFGPFTGHKTRPWETQGENPLSQWQEQVLSRYRLILVFR